MARVSKEEKQNNHERIVLEASRQYREKGIDATGIADVMKAVGMTHGGFYRHFASKEDLVCAAINTVFETIITKLERDFEQKGPLIAITNYVDAYLSQQHVDAMGHGCPIAALAVETARGPEAYKQILDQGTNRIIELLAKAFSSDPDHAVEESTRLLTGMVGAIILARILPLKTKRNAIVITGRKAAYRILSKSSPEAKALLH